MARSSLIARYFCLLLSLVLMVFAVAACQPAATTTGTTKATTTQGTATTGTTGTTAPVEKPPVTLTLFRDGADTYNGAWKWGDDPVSRKITELTGITIETTYATTTGGEELSTMLAAGRDLPDLIYATNESRANLIRSQGFALSVNKLADQYNQDFFKWCPEEFILINEDENGDIYCPPNGFFGNVTENDDVKAPMTVAGVCINMPLYDTIGKPALDTWEDVYAALVKAKETGITFPLYMDHGYITQVANSPTNTVQLITKCFGGGSVIWPQADDSVLLNLRQPQYLEAIKYLNRLYRAGLINPENFTITKNEILYDIAERGQIFMHIGHGYSIFSATKLGQSADAMYWPIDFPVGPGVKHEDVRFRDFDRSTVSTYSGLFVMKDTKHPDRCIDFITFLLSDEGQMLQREGLEGSSYNMVNGIMVYTEERIKLEMEDPQKPALVLGLRHPALHFATMSKVNAMFRYIRGGIQPPYGSWCTIQADHLANERIYDLALTLKTEDNIVLRTKVFDVWSKAQPQMILAETEAECLAAYNKCIADMEQTGLKSLEAIYSASYKYWKDKGIALP